MFKFVQGLAPEPLPQPGRRAGTSLNTRNENTYRTPTKLYNVDGPGSKTRRYHFCYAGGSLLPLPKQDSHRRA